MRFEAFSRAAAQQRSDCLVIGAFERGELGTERSAVDRAHARACTCPVRTR